MKGNYSIFVSTSVSAIHNLALPLVKNNIKCYDIYYFY